MHIALFYFALFMALLIAVGSIPAVAHSLYERFKESGNERGAATVKWGCALLGLVAVLSYALSGLW